MISREHWRRVVRNTVDCTLLLDEDVERIVDECLRADEAGEAGGTWHSAAVVLGWKECPCQQCSKRKRGDRGVVIPDVIPLKCPSCQRALRSTPLMLSSTEIVKRTCRCGEHWQVKIRPMPSPGQGMFVHECEWTFLGRVKRESARCKAQ